MIENPPIPNPDASSLLTSALGIFMWAIGILSVGVIIYASVRIITARGDVEKAVRGRREIVWGMVGLIIALLAAFIVNVILDLT
jgi:hypothetical protein